MQTIRELLEVTKTYIKDGAPFTALDRIDEVLRRLNGEELEPTAEILSVRNGRDYDTVTVKARRQLEEGELFYVAFHPPATATVERSEIAVLEELADWHDTQATMAEPMEMDECVRFHEERRKILLEEATRLRNNGDTNS